MAQTQPRPSSLGTLLPVLAAAAAILALPLLGAVLGGLPLGELLQIPLTTRPWDPLGASPLITWLAATLSLALLAATAYFAWPRRPGGRRLPAPAPRRIPRFAWLGVFALLLAIIAADGAAVSAVVGLAVLALALFANADTERRTGSSLLSQRPGYFRSLFAASLAAGWLFHWLNLFLKLWVYPPATELVPFLLGNSLAYAVLLPALLSLRQWLASLPAVLGAVTRAEPLSGADASPQEGLILLLAALLGLAGAALWPDWIYPLSLSAPLLLAVAIQQLRGRPTPLAGLQTGDWSRLLLPALAALLLGLVAQGLNAWLGPAWALHLPLLGGPELLDLPLPGWVWIMLLGPFGVWLGDQLAEPWQQRPQQPPPAQGRFPVRIEIGDGS
ncbi:hypothetical protein [uncultured Thiohalocapsa sp.]|uniref:hypothetical protein n=1 Tax=uncultured Thiohalocapsa sp. TaxID=768990 RepID=UPI0025F1B456|nr:hypothetical protein [uncultured Thiohalocapsa sp.]